MWKRVLVPVLLAFMAFLLAALFLINRPQPTPTLSFAQKEPGPGYMVGAFYVTNRTSHPILLWRVKSQTFTDGTWKTVFEGPPQPSFNLNPGETLSKNISPLLQPGEYQKIAVRWPSDFPWRVSLQYNHQYKGLLAFVSRSRFRLRNRTLPTTQSWGYGPEILTVQIPK